MDGGEGDFPFYSPLQVVDQRSADRAEFDYAYAVRRTVVASASGQRQGSPAAFFQFPTTSASRWRLILTPALCPSVSFSSALALPDCVHAVFRLLVFQQSRKFPRPPEKQPSRGGSESPEASGTISASWVDQWVWLTRVRPRGPSEPLPTLMLRYGYGKLFWTPILGTSI